MHFPDWLKRNSLIAPDLNFISFGLYALIKTKFVHLQILYIKIFSVSIKLSSLRYITRQDRNLLPFLKTTEQQAYTKAESVKGGRPWLGKGRQPRVSKNHHAGWYQHGVLGQGGGSGSETGLGNTAGPAHCRSGKTGHPHREQGSHLPCQGEGFL
jgi:hypothetical protein